MNNSVNMLYDNIVFRFQLLLIHHKLNHDKSDMVHENMTKNKKKTITKIPL